MKWAEFEKKKLVKSFSIDYYSQVYEEHFKGDFVCKKQMIIDSIGIEIEKAKLTQGHVFDSSTSMGISREAEYFTISVATCKVCLIKTPEWFDLEDLEQCKDHVLVMKVAKEVLDYEESFRGSNTSQSAEVHQGRPEESKDAGGGSPGNSPLSRKGETGLVTAKKMVDDEVPSISKI